MFSPQLSILANSYSSKVIVDKNAMNFAYVGHAQPQFLVQILLHQFLIGAYNIII